MSHNNVARVVSILSPTKVVINKGSNDEVEKGQRFVVFSHGDHVKDPETGEDLGQIEVVKGKGEVVHPQERMATLETYELDDITRTVEQDAKFWMLPERTIRESRKVKRQFEDVQIGDLARPL